MSHVYDKYKVAAGFEMEGTGKDTFVISPGIKCSIRLSKRLLHWKQIINY